jgi:hypothetical protein
MSGLLDACRDPGLDRSKSGLLDCCTKGLVGGMRMNEDGRVAWEDARDLTDDLLSCLDEPLGTICGSGLVDG